MRTADVRLPQVLVRAAPVLGAVLSLALGYADLARGGTTLAPLLLVAGYCGLVPAALWLSRGGGGNGVAEPPRLPRPSYLPATLGAAGVFVLYLATLAPSAGLWDGSEYVAAAYTLGIPHPPGNPLFVLLGRVFAVLPIADGVAVRVNLLAALSSAVAAGFWFLIAERAVAGWLPARWQRLAVGTVALVTGATAFTVWNQSVVNEKVYTVSLAGIALVSWLTVRWAEEPEGIRADRLLVIVAYLLGLGYANHMAGMLPLPAVALAVVALRPRTFLRGKLLAACAAALLLGMTPFATQPIRAAFNPPINEGEPTACRNGLELSCTFSRGTYEAFRYNFTREQYAKPPLRERQASFAAQVEMWWLYFRWQWLRDAHGRHPGAQAALAGLFLVLGLLGGWVHLRRDRRSFWYFGSLVFLLTLGLVYYLNFRYGASQRPDLPVPREVRDRDYFYLWGFSAWGVWVALGLASVWRWTAARVGGTESVGAGREAGVRPPRRALALCAPVLALALIPLAANWTAASRRNDRTAIAFAHDLLNSVEPYGVLVTAGDNDTFPLWYAQEVEGVRKDVTVAVLSLLNTDWFVRGIIRRPVHEYDAASGPGIYRGRRWPKPDGPPLRLTLAEADSFPPYLLLAEPVEFRAGEIEATIDPRNLQQVRGGGGVLERADLLVLRMIADSSPERPVYISRTTGAYAERLGLGGNLLTQGLARKVIPRPPAPSADTVRVQGAGWLDLGRTHALWSEVFRGPAAIVELGDWVDRPSLSTPAAYLFTGAELAGALRARDHPQAAVEVMDTVGRVARAVRLDGAFSAAPLEGEVR